MSPRPFDRTRTLLALAPVLVAGCGSGDSGMPLGANLLNGTLTGGAARVVAITATTEAGVENTTLVYANDLEATCSASWRPQGTLCDDDRDPATERNSATRSAKSNRNSGATFEADDGLGGAARGILVIDACFAPLCSTITFDEARVFQMFSDGKTSSVRLAVHPSRGDTPPAWDDAGWTEIVTETPVGPGLDANGDGSVVEDPTVLTFASTTTRYVRVEVWNDGTHGAGSYTELRSLKLFDDPAR